MRVCPRTGLEGYEKEEVLSGLEFALVFESGEFFDDVRPDCAEQ